MQDLVREPQLAADPRTVPLRGLTAADRQRLRIANIALFLSVAVLTLFGVVMLYSTTVTVHGERLLFKQTVWISLGICVAAAAITIDYRRLAAFSKWLLLAAVLPLIYLATVHLCARAGVSSELLGKLPLVGRGAVNGAYRWLYIGSYSVQPSEFAKVAIILFMASYYGSRPRSIFGFRDGVLKPMLAVGGVTLAILLGGSLSVTMITGTIVFGLLFIAGVQMRYLLLPLVLGAALFWLAIMYSPERMSRITSYRNPEQFKDGSGYQLYCSQLALGSGSWQGIGFNQSRMKQRYLPESHTDFILSIVGEELGFAAVLLIISAYLGLVMSAFAISIMTPDRTGMLLAVGVGLMIGLNAFVHIGVVSGFLPTTGITAPLISYGGSHMLATWIALGLLVSVGRGNAAAADEPDENSIVPRDTGLSGPRPALPGA